MRTCRQGCGKAATFNFPRAGLKPDFCADHREEGMVNLRATDCEVGLCICAGDCGRSRVFACARARGLQNRSALKLAANLEWER